MYNPLSIVFGNSLLTSKFKEWKKFRKIMEPTFSNRIIDSYVSTFHEKSQRMADLLQERCHGEPFNMADYSLPCALEMLSETSLGVPMNIQEHMVSTMVENPGLLSIEELQDQVMVGIAAGTDTTAYAVATTLMLLGLHQDVQRKVLEEQESIFGKDTSQPVTTRDLQQMVYLEQVINETMRLYPILPIMARRVDEDVSVNSYTLPAGTIVIIPIYLVHRNPEYFPNPDTFDPDRFSRKNIASRLACSFIPFSYGRKKCLGKSYAYMAMKTMLSVLLRRYEVLECGSREDMECFEFEFFFKFKHGHSIRLRQRTVVIK
ncbi:cytochrome P450 4C1-like [Bacillus rossius redtenbacheri]|uniref:cytochrome P450 4C1-like n=1 Tax=Bacillus rossius redtenbacheri TaxID=93214 RepID=UPI002FDDFCBC